MTLSKCLNLSDPQSLPIESGGNNTHLTGLLCRVNEIKHIEQPGGTEYMADTSSYVLTLLIAAADSHRLIWTPRGCPAGPRWNPLPLAWSHALPLPVAF